MRDSTALTLALLRRELTNDPAVPLPAPINEATLQQVFLLSARHDLGHMVGAALIREGVDETLTVTRQFRQFQYMALYRYEYISFELTRTRDALNTAKIPHMLLKGAHLRQYYPAPEMRTSSDIDLLVKPHDLDHAVEILTEQVGYTYVRHGSHDVLLRTPNGLLFELHFTLTDAEQYRENRDISALAWESAVLLEDSDYSYTMSPEMLFFHHVSHMAKHFVESGCGIRFFMDLWILMHRAPAYDAERLHKMLADSGLAVFGDAVCSLAEVWFSGAAPTSLTDQIADFVTGGGVYGSMQNRTRLKRVHQNRVSYLLSRLFLPYDSMKYQYPILQKHAWLLPFCEVHRWFRLLSKPTAKRIRSEIAFNSALTPELRDETRALLEQLQL